jgi:CubicO group peptidase (beta-lactamase class C family)
MKTKGILSYLYYQDGEVLIDELSPKEKLGDFLNNETKFYSMSMGKSVTSYLVGHAICDGYIDGVDARVNDWPVIKDSIYHDQKLINFLNMNTGDQKYIDEFEDGTSKLGAYEDRDIETTMRLFFRNKNIKKSKERYNYNGFVTQLILNYMKFKIGEDYDKFYSKVFNDKIKIKNSIRYGYTSFKEENGNGHPNIMATRFDYLRIAKAIMDDYQNGTCVGKYLKEIYERRIPKKLTEERNEPLFNRTKSYGGQFHMDFPGLKDKVLFGMGGYGGNMIIIDVENSRILVVNSLHYNNKKYKYNHKKLLHNPFKKGK